MAIDAARAKTLFLNASDLTDPAERAAYLDRECGDDGELRARVEALLRANDGAPLPSPGSTEETVDTGSRKPDPEATGEHTSDADASRLGGATTAEFRMKLEAGIIISDRYTLQEPIGEGGMGEVWVARQTEPVKRKVALKLIKQGMDSRAVLARFEQERQALAMMDHPNIARVLDAGLTQTGQPFFVMELVNGLPLNRFCDELKLTPRERLELFVPICQAVQHAHQKGIVHRDLKPANILITMIDGKPVPKVIDFGVAKATAGKLTDESMSTQFGAIVGTLEYMSPEQAGFSGIDIDTRADIYSLGVILYELLTGLRPIDAKRLKKAALTEMIRIIQEEEPSKPSTRLSTDEALPSLAALRHTEPRRLMAMLRGELDWVVMKCLEKSRERRYETANALARDIQRYLSDEAVEARPPSAGYRFGKFLKRNKGAVLAASLVLLALLGGMAGTTYGLIRAREARDAEAEQKAKAITQRDRAIAAERQTAAERDRAIAAEAKTQTINDFLINDLLTQAEPANNDVEDKVTLREVLDRAAEKVGRRFAGQPDLEAALRVTIANTYHGLASWDKAEAQWRALLEMARKRDPRSADVYESQGSLAHILRHRGRSDAEVLTLARSAAEGLERTLGPDDAKTLTALAHLAGAYLEAGRPSDAIPLLESTLKQQESKLGPDHPSTLTTRSSLAVAYQGAGRLSDAVPLYESTLKQQESKLGPDHPDTLGTRNNLALVYQGAGRLSEAISLLESMLKQVESKFGPDHPNTLTTRYSLAVAYQAAGRVLDAIPLLESTLKQQESKLGPDHPDTLRTCNSLAVAYQSAGRVSDAIPLLESTLKQRESKLGPDHPGTLSTRGNLASAYWAAGRVSEAIPLFESTLKQRESKLGPDHPDTLLTRGNLAFAYHRAGRLSEAIPLLESTLKQSESKLGPDHPNTLTIRNNLASAYRDAGRVSEAIPLLESTLKQFESKLGPDHPSTLATRGNLASAYGKAGRSAEAAKLVQELLANARKSLTKESPQLAGALAQIGLNLLQAKAHLEAEPLLRECLAIREKVQAEAWNTFSTKSMLGGALMGQKKYDEAGPLLMAGYEGMKQREATIPPQSKSYLIQALERLVEFYEATGKPDEAAKWRKELEARRPQSPPK